MNRSLGHRLTDVAQVVVYDHRGNGRSEGDDPSRWNLDTWADDVRGLCDKLGVDRPIVVGGSFGGFVAMRYAARHPTHPAGLGLLCTNTRFDPEPSIEAFRRLGGDAVAEIVRRDYSEGTAETSDLFMQHAAPLMSRHPDAATIVPRAFGLAVRRQEVELHYNNGEDLTRDQRSDLSCISCPTVVVVGEDDPITPVVQAEEIVAGLKPGLARLIRIPGAGHMLFIDALDEVAAAVRVLIRTASAGASAGASV